MDSAFIHQAANELVQNAGTRNIKQIARSCSLDISETSRIKDHLGYDLRHYHAQHHAFIKQFNLPAHFQFDVAAG